MYNKFLVSNSRVGGLIVLLEECKGFGEGVEKILRYIQVLLCSAVIGGKSVFGM